MHSRGCVFAIVVVEARCWVLELLCLLHCLAAGKDWRECEWIHFLDAASVIERICPERLFAGLAVHGVDRVPLICQVDEAENQAYRGR